MHNNFSARYFSLPLAAQSLCGTRIVPFYPQSRVSLRATAYIYIYLSLHVYMYTVCGAAAAPASVSLSCAVLSPFPSPSDLRHSPLSLYGAQTLKSGFGGGRGSRVVLDYLRGMLRARAFPRLYRFSESQTVAGRL